MKTNSSDLRRFERADLACRHSAAKRLGLAPDADACELRARMFALLEEEDLLPPAAMRHAFDYLSGGSTTVLPFVKDELLAAHESCVGADLDEFAATFFQLPIGKRRERWQQLWDDATFSPPHLAWLRRLEAGLNLDLADLAALDSNTRDLAEEACRLFILRGETRAAQCELLLARLCAEPAEWRPAARLLKQKSPGFAALVPRLVDALVLPAVRRRVWPDEWLFSRLLGIGKSLRKRAPQPASQQAASGTAWPRSNFYARVARWALFIIAVVSFKAYENWDAKAPKPLHHFESSRPKEFNPKDVPAADLENFQRMLREHSHPKAAPPPRQEPDTAVDPAGEAAEDASP